MTGPVSGFASSDIDDPLVAVRLGDNTGGSYVEILPTGWMRIVNPNEDEDRQEVWIQEHEWRKLLKLGLVLTHGSTELEDDEEVEI
jgi:hypothetical protein